MANPSETVGMTNTSAWRYRSAVCRPADAAEEPDAGRGRRHRLSRDLQRTGNGELDVRPIQKFRRFDEVLNSLAQIDASNP